MRINKNVPVEAESYFTIFNTYVIDTQINETIKLEPTKKYN